MPEGDSLYRLAARLRPVLLGRTVKAFRVNEIADDVTATLVGRSIVEVVSRGKNLIIRFDDGRFLHVHLMMLGRVRIERPRSAYWKPRVTAPQMRLEVQGTVVVGDRIPVIRLVKAGNEARAEGLATLGPDLLAEEVDEDECVVRLRALGKRPIGEALMLQRALAGIGNIYKSETLFLEKIDPTTPVADLDDDALRGLVRRASTLLKRNLGSGPRITRPALTGSHFYVYGRRGKGCFRCRTAIEMIRQGAPPGRSTYHCPSCQQRAGGVRPERPDPTPPPTTTG